jgi:hypothetical protein
MATHFTHTHKPAPKSIKITLKDDFVPDDWEDLVVYFNPTFAIRRENQLISGNSGA